MERIEVNVQTGEQTVIQLTPEENAILLQREAQVQLEKRWRFEDARARSVSEKLALIGLTIAELKAELARV